MFKPLDETDKQIAYSQGFIEAWLKGDPKTPAQILEHLGVITNGVSSYREKYLLVQEDLNDLRQKYIELTSLSSSYLQLIQNQKELLEKNENPVELNTERLPG